MVQMVICVKVMVIMCLLAVDEDIGIVLRADKWC